MCRPKPYPRCSNHARKALDDALASGDAERIRRARRQFYTSVAGIQILRDSNKVELADKYLARRNRLIAEAKRLERSKIISIRVGLDVDNTSGDFTDGFRTRCVASGNFTPKQIAEMFPEPIDYSFVESGWFKDKEAFIAAFSKAENEGVYREMKIYPQAAKTLRKLVDSGKIEIHVVTARNPKWNADTRIWLRKHRIPYTSLTFTDKKEETDMDVYLDDAGYQLTKLRDHGKKVIAFDQLYNRHIDPTIPRVKHWGQVPAMITKVTKVSK